MLVLHCRIKLDIFRGFGNASMNFARKSVHVDRLSLGASTDFVKGGGYST